MSGLSITGLHASHGRNTILTGVDLTVDNGALACVLGPSGCGKSTLLRVIAGFHPAARGQVALGGRVIDDGRRRLPAERRRIGYVPQDGALFPHLTVAQNIGFGLPRAKRRERAAELLHLIGLDSLGDRHPHQLSGGQQQRVALARALAPEPELLLLDEPFSALDAALRGDLRAEVAATLRRAGTTAVLVTHDQEEALSFADTIAVIRTGQVIQQAPPEQLYQEPADADVARLIGEANLLPARLDGTQAETALGPLPLTRTTSVTGPATVMLRPRQLQLSTTAGPHAVQVSLSRSVYRGHDHRLELSPHNSEGLPGRLIAYTDTPPPGDGPVYVQAVGAAHPLSGTAMPAVEETLRPASSPRAVGAAQRP
ncbi:ABC transporter ATP-binding protein [Streptomyces violascens]|uniref:ABC transporter ATP-binding protein n=1 Tax=Streptomyces violascens TaxID=67381 RepID=UPI00367485DC